MRLRTMTPRDGFPARHLAPHAGTACWSRWPAATPSGPSQRWSGCDGRAGYARRRYHRGLGMALMHGRVPLVPVIRAVPGHRLGYPIERRRDLRGILDAAVGQRGGDDPAAARVHPDAQGAPGAPPLDAVPTNHSPGPHRFSPVLSISR